MKYIEIYFKDPLFHKVLVEGSTPELNKFLNSKDDMPFFQDLSNELFSHWIKYQKLSGQVIYESDFKIFNSDDFPNCTEEEFEELNQFLVKREMLYISNWFYDKTDEPYSKLFNFDSIIKSLNKLESDSHVFFINNYSIINIIHTYLLGKFHDFYLRNRIGTNQRRGHEITNKHFFETILRKALIYKSIDLDFNSDSAKQIVTKLAMSCYYEELKGLISNIASFLKVISNNDYKEDVLYKCLYDFRNFRKEVLGEVSKYLITFQELDSDKDLFKMTHQKRLLLYELLRQIEPDKGLPLNQKEFEKYPTSTSRFDDFKKNEVIKHFG